MAHADTLLPLVDLRRQYDTIRDEILQAANTVMDNTDFIMGQAVAEFEGAFAAFCGARHAIGVASGTAAIHLVLHALGIGPGDEVITVAHTFIATAEPIILLGARPIFVDVSADDSNLDPRRLEEAITPRTKAIMPVHLYGLCANMDAILDIAGRHNLPVVEDAAQAQGATYRGKMAGTLGVAGCFSFYPGKNLGAFGDAGAITTDDDALAARLRRLRNHGRKDKYEHLEPGYGERLDTLQAAILYVKLGHLADWNERRRAWADRYTRGLQGIPDLQTPVLHPERTPIYHQYVIRHPRRDALAAHLKAHRIQTGIHYPIPLHLQPALRYLEIAEGELPVTEHLAKTILSLPMFPELTAEEVDHVIGAIRTFKE